MHKSSTHDIVNALNILSSEIHSFDGAANALCAEASARILELVNLTKDLTAHIVSNPVHHPKCNAATKGNYCNCMLSKLSSP
jgi:hypothetical protein